MTQNSGEWLAAKYVASNDPEDRRWLMTWLIEHEPDAHKRTMLLERALEFKHRIEGDVLKAQLRG